MRQEEAKVSKKESFKNPSINQQNKVRDKSEDSDEYGDEVGSLPGKRVQSEHFDSILESKDSSKPQQTSSPTRQ